MSALTSFLYPLPAPRRSAGAVIAWWEARRFSYNLIVGATGCATVTISTLLMAIPARVTGGPPPLVLILGGSLLYGVMANLCYCLGPIAELAMYRLWKEEAPRAGPALFRQGLIFSVGLTLFPVALVALGVAARLAAWLLS